MNPVELIKQHLGDSEWKNCRKAWMEQAILRHDEDLSPLCNYKTYRVQGGTNQFDFPMLPHCSYGIYIANGSQAIRLTRKNKEIEQVLAEEWSLLAKCAPIILARLILMFYDEGIRATHRVLANAEALMEFGRPKRDYVLDEQEYASAFPKIGNTEIHEETDIVVLRAVTLCGWMHEKRNLGIERIHIPKSGRVKLEKREVLSRRIFKSVPQIMY